MKSKVFFLLSALFLTFSIRAQQGKDGAPTISTSTVVNIYTSASSNITAGTNTLIVANASGYNVGDLIYIIQMQGASINAEFYQFGDPTNSYQVDASKPYGQVLNYNNCGNNEFAQINAISGTTFTVDCNLKNNYDASGKVQVIRVPRYNSLTINSGGTVTCPQWNGTTGGVIAIEVFGNTTINTGGKIDASSLGFRGGNIHNGGGLFGISNLGTTHWEYAAWKGEGIAGDTAFYRTLSGEFGLGAMGNGGGAGIENNSGGGGGANAGNVGRWQSYGVPDVSVASYATCFSIETPRLDTAHSSGGGRGGYSFSSANKDPRSVIPGDATWNGDKRSNRGGQGGQPLDYSTGRLFMGGGGGAGDEDNGYSGGGGNGGGIVYLITYSTVIGGGQILSNGANGVSTNTTTSTGGSGFPRGKDGAGGAGAGGTIIVQSSGNISLTNAQPISASGGQGGNQILSVTTGVTSEAYGPGGGGGGGYISTSNSVTNITVSGGSNGVCSQIGALANNNTNIIKYFSPNGATKGDTGIKTVITPPYTLTGISDTVCIGSTASLSVTVNGTTPSGFSVEWYTVAIGGTAVATGTTYTTGSVTGNTYTFTAPSSAGTYTYYAGSCPGTYRTPVLLIVNSSSAPSININTTNTLVCSGTTVTLTASGATSYTWDANAGNATTNTVVVTPNANTTYTLTGATTGACAGTNTASITINVSTPPTITITPSSYSVCSGVNDTLKATGATSYTWSANAGSATTSSVVIPSNTIGSTTYSVTGVSGACSSTQSVSINVTATPTVSISPVSAYICKGSNTTFTASGANTYSWSTSSTTNTVSVSPTTNTTYTVTGYNGTCSDIKTVLVKVDNGITKADSIFNSASCGQSNGSYVLNSVTGGISPYQINFNGTGFAAIGAFSYTVSSLAGNSYPIVIKDSLGCTYTTSVTIGNTSGITAVDSSTTNTNCNASVGVITINSVIGGTPSYQANIDGGTFNTINSFPYSFNNLAVGTHTIIVKDATGCQHPSLIMVNSNGGPSAVATSTVQPDTCGKNVGTITVGSVTGGTTPYQYSIDGTNYQTANTFTALPANTYTLYVKDNTGCSITSSATVTSISGPTSASVTVIPDTCNKHVGVITISQVIGGTSPYTYALNGGTYQSANTFTALAASTYTTQIKDNSGCVFTVTPNTTVVTINSVTTPTIIPSGNTTFCNGGNLTLSSSSATSYTWSTGANTQTITVNSSGVYTVTTTSSTGCTAMDTITVTVKNNPAPPIPNDITVNECQNNIQSISLTPTGTVVVKNSIGQNQPIPFTPTVSGIYTAYDSLNGCTSAVKTITVNINAAPIIAPTVTTPVVYCQGQTADTLKAIATTTGADLIWQDANHNIILTPPTPTPLTSLAGTTTYYVYQSIGVCNGPLDSIKVVVMSKPNPHFTINPTTDIFVGQTIAFTPIQTTTTNVYYWNFDDATSITNTSSSVLPTHAYNTAGSYCPKLIVTNLAGCKDSTTLCLDVLSNISMVIPNVFTPNGDGLNDVFSVKATGYNNFTCDIFDRWGLKLYSWTGTSGYWDGTEKTSKAVDGTYFYVIQATDIKGQDHKFNGFIQLIK